MGDPGKTYSAFNQVYTGGGFEGASGSSNDNIPAAYLNMVMFNNDLLANSAELPMAAIPITAAAFTKQKLTIGPINIPAPGFVYIYVNENSNSNNWVHFDDLKITHVRSPFVSGADYYPFGLTMSDREILTEPYRFGYQGQFAEEDTETGWNAFDLRMYDARFGRWLSPDPYGQFASPYLAMGNMPNSSVDSDGGMSSTMKWMLGTAVVGGIAGGLLDENNRARGAAIGFTAGLAAGYGLSKVNLSAGSSSIGNVYASVGDNFDPVDLSNKALQFAKDAMTTIAKRTAEEIFVKTNILDQVNYPNLMKDYNHEFDKLLPGHKWWGFDEPETINVNMYLGGDSGPYVTVDPLTKIKINISRSFPKSQLDVGYISKLKDIRAGGQNNLLLSGWGYELAPTQNFRTEGNPSRVYLTFSNKPSAIKFYDKYYIKALNSKLSEMNKKYHIK